MTRCWASRAVARGVRPTALAEKGFAAAIAELLAEVHRVLAPGGRVGVFEPDWRERPWPPRDKYGHGATDDELGL